MALLEPAAGKASGTGIPDGAALTGAKIDLLKFTVLIILTQQRLLGTLGGRRGGGMSTFHLHYTLSGSVRSFTVKENHIGPAIGNILRQAQTHNHPIT